MFITTLWRTCMLLAIGVAVAGAQGLYWESTTTGGPAGDAGEITKTYAMPKMFKVEIPNQSNAMILRMDREMMYTVDHKAKSYWQMTFAEMEASLKKASEKMDELSKQMENMPPEQRKMMEQMMGNRMKKSKELPPVSVVGPSERKTIRGYSCSKYVALREGDTLVTVWATKDVGEFAAMRNDFEAFNKRLASMDIGGAQAMSEAFRKIDGFPMRMEMGGVTSEVTKVESRSLKAKEFEVPAGYTKTDPPGMGEPAVDQ